MPSNYNDGTKDQRYGHNERTMPQMCGCIYLFSGAEILQYTFVFV